MSCQTLAKVGLILLVLTSICHSADSLYFYSGGKLNPVPIDHSKFAVQFEGVTLDEGVPMLKALYPSLSFDSTQQPHVEDFGILTVSNPDQYDSLYESVRALPYVSIVNPVGFSVGTMPMYIGQSFVCRFSSSVSPGEIADLMDQYHLEVLSESECRPHEYLIRVTSECEYSVVEIANLFYEMPQTEYSLPNTYCPVTLDSYEVLDYYYNWSQTNVKKTVSILGLENAAWEISTGDTSIYVGIIDEGIEPHEDFTADKFWYGFDLVGGIQFCFDTFPEPIHDTKEFHGMSVLGLLSAEHNNPVEGADPDEEGIYYSTAGIAPKCRVFGTRMMGYEVFQDDTVRWAVSHLNVADAISLTFLNGADVINCSWTWHGNIEYDDINNAIDSAAGYGRNGLGALIIFSSGNQSQIYGDSIQWPKTKNNVLTVGAIDYNDTWYDYSCYGPTLDLVAPSSISYSGQPAYTGGIWATDRMGLLGDNPSNYDGCAPTNDSDYRCTFGGTSAAAPLVTGTAALILSKRPELTAAQLMDVLKQSAVTNLDWGSITTPDEKYGYGRVNAFRALVAVARGDANNSGLIEVSDAVYLINYIFKDGPEPVPHYLMGDFNCDGAVNVGDAVSVIAYVFRGGPAPEVCTDHLP